MDPELIKLLTGIASSGGGGSVLIVMLIVVGYSIRKGYLSFGNGHCPDLQCKVDIMKGIDSLAVESREDRKKIHEEISTLTGYVEGFIKGIK